MYGRVNRMTCSQTPGHCMRTASSGTAVLTTALSHFRFAFRDAGPLASRTSDWLREALQCLRLGRATWPSGSPVGLGSGAVTEGAECPAQAGGEGRQLPGRGGMQDGQIDRPVAVHDPVAEPLWLLPGDVRKLGSGFLGYLACCLAKHREVPQQGIPPLPVGLELADGDAAGKALRL